MMSEQKQDKDVAGKKAQHVQPTYNKPPKSLPGFPDAKRVRSKGGRQRWADKKRIYEWDYQHAHLEGWDKTGKEHQGSFDPNDGKTLKPADKTKRPITPTIATPIKKEDMIKDEKEELYVLGWYSVEDDSQVGEEEIRLQPAKVRELFFIPEDEPAIFCYDVTASQRQFLAKKARVEIDLNKHVYQLGSRAE